MKKTKNDYFLTRLFLDLLYLIGVSPNWGRHGTLDPAFGGSSPPTPVKKFATLNKLKKFFVFQNLIIDN